MIEHVLELFKQFPEVNAGLSAGILVFARFSGFAKFAPILHRKEVPTLIRVSFSLLMTVAFVGIMDVKSPPADGDFILSIFLNIIFGFIIGYIGQTIFATITAAGDMINMQMGLSSAVMFDQSTKSQSSVMGKLIGLFGLIIFFNIGGVYYLFEAFQRSFEIFPIYNTQLPLDKIISMDYLIIITSNVLYVGLQIAAPVLLATLGQDIILGIISKTAPQVNVFQLSFLFKPVLGAVILVVIMPILYNVITDYFIYYSKFY